MLRYKTKLLSSLAFVSLTAASVSSPVIDDINQFSFVNMQNDSTISLSYSSSGCFHSDSGVMRFTSETMSFRNQTKTVRFEDMAGLDSYFTALARKQNQPGGCTSRTDLTLTLTRDGDVVGHKTLRDDFCFIDEGGVSPGSLKYKLFEKEAAEQQSLIPE